MWAWFRLPLVQCRQKFLSMDVKYRNELQQSLRESAQKFQLEDITYSSFVAKFGYRIMVSTFVGREEGGITELKR